LFYVSGGNQMKHFAKAVALSAILGGLVLATTPAQAFWGWPGSGGGWPGGWGGSPWGGGYPGRYGNWNDDWMDGSGWGDMTFSTSVGGRGYGRGYDRYYNHGYPYWGGYPYGGYGGPWGGYAPYGGGYAPYGGGYAPYGGGYAPGYGYPGGGSYPAPSAPDDGKKSQ
jgi:hypothetical protein